MRKRIISLVLAFCIVISLLAVPALAADTPTVSGVWVFNELIVLPSAQIYQSVSYTSADIEYFEMRVIVTGMQAGIKYWGDTSRFNVYLADEWNNDTVRIVDFGTTEQVVSQEFYEWFTANAIQQAAECPHDNTEIRNAKCLVCFYCTLFDF